MPNRGIGQLRERDSGQDHLHPIGWNHTNAVIA